MSTSVKREPPSSVVIKRVIFIIVPSLALCDATLFHIPRSSEKKVVAVDEKKVLQTGEKDTEGRIK